MIPKIQLVGDGEDVELQRVIEEQLQAGQGHEGDNQQVTFLSRIKLSFIMWIWIEIIICQNRCLVVPRIQWKEKSLILQAFPHPRLLK